MFHLLAHFLSFCKIVCFLFYRLHSCTSKNLLSFISRNTFLFITHLLRSCYSAFFLFIVRILAFFSFGFVSATLLHSFANFLKGWKKGCFFFLFALSHFFVVALFLSVTLFLFNAHLLTIGDIAIYLSYRMDYCTFSRFRYFLSLIFSFLCIHTYSLKDRFFSLSILRY